jgi:S1-C subfamily serine protease
VLTTEGKDYSTVRVMDVLENSPAAQAGIQKDDILVSVDGKPAAELKATKIAELFEKPSTYKLTIRRGEQTLQVPLTPKRMI